MLKVVVDHRFDIYYMFHIFFRRIHPDIRELCDAFYVEERHVEKLNELMKERGTR
jgi:hypothetical protein